MRRRQSLFKQLMLAFALSGIVATAPRPVEAGPAPKSPPPTEGAGSSKKKSIEVTRGKSGEVDLSEAPANTKAEAADLKRLGEGFQVFHTKHFSILHDVSEEDVGAFSTALERTFRSDLKYTLTLGIEPKKPKKKLIIYYFNEHDKYTKYSEALGKGPRPQSNPGVFFPDMNRSMFYNFQNQASFKQVREQAEEKLKQLRERGKGKMSPAERRQLNHEIAQARFMSNASTQQGGGHTEETVQHEATHHVLWNIGFHNPDSFMANPRWFVEGTAMMFETTAKSKSANIGAVNKGRLEEFQTFDKEKKLHPVKEFVCDSIYFNEGGEAVFVSYAQSWALVHYLNRTQRDQIKGYVAEINKRPRNYESTPEKELATFEKAFGKLDRKWIDKWKSWMKKVR